MVSKAIKTFDDGIKMHPNYEELYYNKGIKVIINLKGFAYKIYSIIMKQFRLLIEL